MQCKVHTFRVLSQDFGEKSKKIGGNLVTWLPAFWMYVYNINKCIKYSRNSLSTAGTGLTLIFWFWKMNRAASTTVSCNALFLSSSEMSCPAKFYYYTLHYSNVGRFFCTPAPPKIYEKNLLWILFSTLGADLNKNNIYHTFHDLCKFSFSSFDPFWPHI